MAKAGMQPDGCDIDSIYTGVYGIYPAIYELRWIYYRYAIDTV